jgi:hypothetical protein
VPYWLICAPIGSPLRPIGLSGENDYKVTIVLSFILN